jgi:NAD(P)-dependent dehydrogenase (short-subunit alcohol dehydrogenase family)
MTARFGLEGRRGLVVGTVDVGAACVARLRDEGMTIAFVDCDLSDRASYDRAVGEAIALAGGRLDVLVTGAGKRLSGSIESTPETDFRDVFEANLTAPFRITRTCMSPMRARGRGSIIYIASDAGIRADHEMAAYSVAAAGVIAAAELFAAEGAADGVRANAVCPNDQMPSEDVAAVVAWLASDESIHVSGATLRVDAGMGAAMVIDTRT